MKIKGLIGGVVNNDLSAVKSRIEAGANVNETFGDKKDSVLMEACRIGNASIVKLLIDNGANPNYQNIDGYTPLMRAVYYPVRNEAGINGFNNMAGIDGFSIVSMLLAKRLKVNVNALNKDDETALHLAVYHNTPQALKIVKLLLKRGADPEIVDRFNNIPLYNAYDFSCNRIVDYLETTFPKIR